MLTIEQIARVCHEANRTYCEVAGLALSVPWSVASEAIKQSAIAGVKAIFDDPLRTPEQSHAAWYAYKEAEGYRWGARKDEGLKTHPCMLSYADLPAAQRVKDMIFVNIVRALMPGELLLAAEEKVRLDRLRTTIEASKGRYLEAIAQSTCTGENLRNVQPTQDVQGIKGAQDKGVNDLYNVGHGQNVMPGIVGARVETRVEDPIARAAMAAHGLDPDKPFDPSAPITVLQPPADAEPETTENVLAKLSGADAEKSTELEKHDGQEHAEEQPQGEPAQADRDGWEAGSQEQPEEAVATAPHVKKPKHHKK